MKLLIQYKRFIIFGTLAILVMCFTFIYFEHTKFRNNTVDNFSRAVYVAISSVDPVSLEKLPTEAGDIVSSDYIRMREQLIKLEKIYSKDGVRGFYFMKMENGSIRFYADSADINDAWHSEPGVVYKEPPVDFINAFKGEPTHMIGPYTDEYGRFYSFLAPIKNNNGNIFAVAGVDIINTYFDNIIHTHTVYEIFAVLFILLIYYLIIFLSFRYSQFVILSKENEVVNKKVEEKIKEAVMLKNEAENKNVELNNTKKAILNVLEDVRQEKEKVENVTKRLELATKSANIGVWDWDIVKNTVTWDENMYLIYGINSKDQNMTYDLWKKLLHPEDVTKVEKMLLDASNGKKVFDTTFRMIHQNKEIRYIKAYAVVERDYEKKPLNMIGVNFDVTHDKEVDREKTEFVSLASHQLKTPVGALNWNLEMLLSGDYGKISEKQHEVVADMYSMNQRMNELINSLLNVSRIEMGVFIVEPVPTSFKKVCNEVLLEMNQKIKNRKQKLIKKYDADLGEISADPKLLRIIFQNYISNAIKYTQVGGSIGISIFKKSNNVVISVTNNGEPIPIDDQGKIFTKLFRASNASEQDPDGNGLGLYLVKQIVENSGGKIWFSSKSGEDTVFACSFPLSGMVKKAGTKQLG